MAGPRTIKSNCGKCTRCITGVTTGTWDPEDKALHDETLRRKRDHKHGLRQGYLSYKKSPIRITQSPYFRNNGYIKKSNVFNSL